jgi:hypothetical protein
MCKSHKMHYVNKVPVRGAWPESEASRGDPHRFRARRRIVRRGSRAAAPGGNSSSMCRMRRADRAAVDVRLGASKISASAGVVGVVISLARAPVRVVRPALFSAPGSSSHITPTSRRQYVNTACGGSRSRGAGPVCPRSSPDAVRSRVALAVDSRRAGFAAPRPSAGSFVQSALGGVTRSPSNVPPFENAKSP